MVLQTINCFDKISKCSNLNFNTKIRDKSNRKVKAKLIKWKLENGLPSFHGLDCRGEI